MAKVGTTREEIFSVDVTHSFGLKELHMYEIDRGVIIIKYKQPFLDWVRNLPDPDNSITLDDLNNDNTAYLVPDPEDDVDGMDFIKDNYAWIFEETLNGWWTDEKDCPVKRNLKTFLDWFNYEYHSVVVDPVDAPIIKEDH